MPTISATPQLTRADDLLGLEQFIHEHHAKSTRGDIDGLMADYASIVDHQEAGKVGQEIIRKEEVEYHAPGFRISEGMRGTPVPTPLADSGAGQL